MVSSIRTRITLAATFVVAIALIFASWLVLSLVKQDLISTTQRALEAELAATEFDDFEQSYFDISTQGRKLQLGVFVVNDDNDQLLFGSVYENNDVLAEVVIDRKTSTIVEMFDARSLADLADSELEKILTGLDFSFVDVATPSEHRQQVIVGATARDQVDETLGYIRAALYIIVPILTVVLAALVWILVGQALKPVDAISRQVEAISTTSLQKRVPVPAGKDAIASLARVMNSMLDRLEAGDIRQRQFSADASHEIRTPLTSVKIAAEMIERRAQDERSAQMARDIIDEADRMDGLVNSLMELSRQDEANTNQTAAVNEFDLAELVSDVIQTQRGSENSDPVITWREPSQPISAFGSRRDLTRVLTNLIDNAKRHCNNQILVTLSAAPPNSDHQTLITVEDDGTGVPVDAREKIFERFSRLDEARSRDQGGFGIGLALVRSIVKAHKGKVWVEDSTTLGGAAFKITL